MDCSPSSSSVHGISQARILEWVAISFSRGSSQPRDWTQVSCIAGRFFTAWSTWEAAFNTSLLLPKVESLFWLPWFLNCSPCFDPGSHPRYHITFSFPVSLGSSWLWQFLRLILVLMILIVLRNTGQVFCNMPLHWNFSVVFDTDCSYGLLEGGITEI